MKLTFRTQVQNKETNTLKDKETKENEETHTLKK